MDYERIVYTLYRNETRKLDEYSRWSNNKIIEYDTLIHKIEIVCI